MLIKENLPLKILLAIAKLLPQPNPHNPSLFRTAFKTCKCLQHLPRHPGQSVRRSVILSDFLTKRRDDIVVADMVADTVADMEVHMVAEKVAGKKEEVIKIYIYFFL